MEVPDDTIGTKLLLSRAVQLNLVTAAQWKVK